MSRIMILILAVTIAVNVASVAIKQIQSSLAGVVQCSQLSR